MRIRKSLTIELSVRYRRAGHDVTLFEKEATCGGHTLTDTSGPAPVDLGFQARDTSAPILLLHRMLLCHSCWFKPFQ